MFSFTEQTRCGTWNLDYRKIKLKHSSNEEVLKAGQVQEVQEAGQVLTQLNQESLDCIKKANHSEHERIFYIPSMHEKMSIHHVMFTKYKLDTRHGQQRYLATHPRNQLDRILKEVETKSESSTPYKSQRKHAKHVNQSEPNSGRSSSTYQEDSSWTCHSNKRTKKNKFGLTPIYTEIPNGGSSRSSAREWRKDSSKNSNNPIFVIGQKETTDVDISGKDKNTAPNEQDEKEHKEQEEQEKDCKDKKDVQAEHVLSSIQTECQGSFKEQQKNHPADFSRLLREIPMELFNPYLPHYTIHEVLHGNYRALNIVFD